ADVDNDGDMDLICGNLGTNSKFKASYKKPFNVFSTDFDQNGTCDIVLSKDYKGKLVPTRGRQCSSEQMPFIKEKFPTYKDFATAGLEDILGKEKLKKALHLQVTDFESKILINNGDGTFTAKALPRLAQVSPINGIIVKDLNQDGNIDLVIAGNMYNTEVETPRYDAGTGLILMGKGNGDFDAIPSGKSGLYAADNVKDIAWVRKKNGAMILVANNNAAPEVFEVL
ncbi:MAG TPA: VCBS repeat-containing protein, partial [Phaeodactylibacter sp.]|nr:VCBS repeat-containing protein [Phaeodactylibacter sp.]